MTEFMPTIEADTASQWAPTQGRILPAHEFNVSLNIIPRPPEATHPGIDDSLVLGNYYSALKEGGRLPFREGVERVTDGIHGLVGGLRGAVKDRVLTIFKETTGPEYVKPAALDLMSQALMLGGEIYIWTVGDHGAGSDYYQKHKIEQSRMTDSLEYILTKNNKDPKTVNTHLHTVISSENKQAKLHEILRDISEQHIGTVFLADDKEDNTAAAKNVVSNFPEISSYFEWVVKKDEDPLGNFAAFRDKMLLKMKECAAKGERFAVVLDWDDTVSNEIERMQEIRKQLSHEFAPRLEPVLATA